MGEEIKKRVHYQHTKSPLQKEGCYLILILPVAAAGQRVSPEQVECGCLGKVVACKKVL